jgi:hypothetical protein
MRFAIPVARQPSIVSERSLFAILTIVITMVSLVSSATAGEFYAAPSGSANGNGSKTQPWNIETALAQPAALKPGDTIWLRGGEYITTSGFTAVLTGTQNAPITVRSLPGERAVLVLNQISGVGLQVIGAWTEYWDLELKSTLSPHSLSAGGLGFNGHHNSLINSVVHDTPNNAPHGNGNLIYGCLFYFNGTNGSGLGHAMYIQNEDPNQPAIFEDNVIFSSYAFGIHAYAGGVGLLNGLHFIGNVAFINGTAQAVGDTKDNYLVGGVNGQRGTILRENMGWSYSMNKRSVALGRYASGNNIDITLSDNYFVGTTLFQDSWQSISMTGNTFYGPVTLNGTSMVADFPNNTYLSAAPTQNKIFIRPNRFETGRAHIIVYNWTAANSAEIDVSSVLPVNAEYELRNAQNYFGAPLLSGTYSGGTLNVPLSGLAMAQPSGGGLIEEPEKTGKNFNVFVLRQTNNGGVAPPPLAPRNLQVQTAP